MPIYTQSCLQLQTNEDESTPQGQRKQIEVQQCLFYEYGVNYIHMDNITQRPPSENQRRRNHFTTSKQATLTAVVKSREKFCSRSGNVGPASTTAIWAGRT